MSHIDEDLIDSQVALEDVGYYIDNVSLKAELPHILGTLKEHLAEGDNASKRFAKARAKTSVQHKTLDWSNTSNNTQGLLPSNQNVQNKELKAWGLPQEIAKKYAERGITEMFEWQVSCLQNPKVLLECANLVYSAPTSAGKTLVAEILTIKTILERQKKVIIILPFVSIVREKMFYLQDILSSSGIRVEGFMGSQSPPGGLQSVHVAVCTIEKANSLVNRLLDEGTISDLGAVVVDELHLLGDPHRGYILELLLTKVKYVTQTREDVKIQIIGMSATLPNLEVLAKWLNAELYITWFRPIPLDEYCLVGQKLFNKDGVQVRVMEDAASDLWANDNVLKICFDTVKDGCSVLIFCMTKSRCESLAQNIASSFLKLGCAGNEIAHILREQLKTESIFEVLEQLQNCPVGLDSILKKVISFGVAYHHAGLTFDERDIIEGAFKSGAIRILVATSTLSSGVNLPARVVIVRTPVFQRYPISIMTYKQMIGRAGRMGKDTKGESILICTEAEKKIGFNLMMGTLEPVNSCIESQDKFLRAILEMVASEVACTHEDLKEYAECTLLLNQQNTLERNVSMEPKLLLNSLEDLQNFELIRSQDVDGDVRFVATSLGKACLAASMAPHDGMTLFCELQKARQCLVLETDLHLIYLVTPYSVSNQWSNIDWLHMLNMWESLTKPMKRVGQLVGIHERHIMRFMRPSKTESLQNQMNIHKRFYTALALQDLVNEMPLPEVATNYQCARGFLQSLQQSAATFAGMVTVFCHQLGWKNMEMLISQFQDRLHFGIHSELLELMKLPSLNGLRARSLFNAGFETVASVASAEVNQIENALVKSVPFQSEKQREGDDDTDIRKRNKLKNVWITGHCGLTIKEAAESLILEARQYVERDLGVNEIKWNKDNNESPVVVGMVNSETINNSSLKQETENFNRNYISIKNEPELFEQEIVTETVNLFDCKVEVEEHDIALTNHENTLKKITDPSKNGFICGDQSDIGSKEDLVWDSLNFTETAINNVTRNRLSEQVFSPDISFSDSETKAKPKPENSIQKSLFKATNKDVSLFSSDGENNSIFDDSLPAELVKSKLLDNRNERKPSSNEKPEILTVNTNSILQAFLDYNIEDDEETLDADEFGLVYDDDIQLITSSPDIESHAFEDKPHDDDIQVITSSPDIEPHGFESSRLFNNEICPITSDTNIQESNEQKDCSKVKNDFEGTFLSFVNTIKEVKCPDISHKKPQCHITSNTNIPELTAQKHCSIDKKYFEGTFLSFVNTVKEVRYPDISHEKPHSNSRVMEKADTKETYIKNALHNCLNKNNIFFKHFISFIDADVIEREPPKKKIRKDVEVTSVSTKKIDNIDVTVFFCLNDNVMPKLNELFEIECAAICFDFRKPDTVRGASVIGQSIVKNTETLPATDDIGGINYFAICSSKENVYAFDLSPFAKTSVVYETLKQWLRRRNFHLVVLSSLETITEIKKYLDVELSASCYNICLAEWLMTQRPLILNVEQQSISEKKLEALCFKTWSIWITAEKQIKKLNGHDIKQQLLAIDNQVSLILNKSENHGLTVDKKLASELLIAVKNSFEVMKNTAYRIAGREFNLNSSQEVAKILGIFKGSRKNTSTKKSILKLHRSLLSDVILYWRKLNAVLTKILYPLTKESFYGKDNKIHPSYCMFTSTGRINMSGLNLQSMPRTFFIPQSFLLPKYKGQDLVEFNCRKIFRASPGYVLVSADYCQLEMRILTFYSADNKLTKIMKSNADVFKSIAARWNDIDETFVDENLRQRAKQLCYGIIYGMGQKTLSEMLDVSLKDAKCFIDSFYETYPGIWCFRNSVIEECRKCGFVETLLQRRRYLPEITCPNAKLRNQAERQALNTKVQGSAADIVKAAMCEVDNRTRDLDDSCKPRLVLQMHDELIYEVPEAFKHNFITTLKDAMENAVQLEIPFPVKVKTGPTWGSLTSV